LADALAVRYPLGMNHPYHAPLLGTAAILLLAAGCALGPPGCASDEAATEARPEASDGSTLADGAPSADADAAPDSGARSPDGGLDPRDSSQPVDAAEPPADLGPPTDAGGEPSDLGASPRDGSHDDLGSGADGGSDANGAPDTAGTPDVAATPDGGQAPPWPLLAAEASCVAAGDPCASLPVVPGLWASYRKDAYLPDEQYAEYTDPPVDGGRLHLAGIAEVGGAITGVLINDRPVTELLQPPAPGIEWHHVWPDPAVAGEPLWVAFHSRSPEWDQVDTGRLRVETVDGVALQGEFPVTRAPLPLTYVTSSDDGTRLLVHLRNESEAAQRLTRLLVNGRDVLAAEVVCLPRPALPAGEALLIEIPRCEPAPPGGAWTVVAEWDGAPPSVGVGRTLRPHFPLEAWPVSSDCVVPGQGGDPQAWAAHRDAGFDTVYLYWRGGERCGFSTPELVHETLPALGDTFALIGDDFLDRDDPEHAIAHTTAVAGFLTGDESDGEVYDDEGRPRPASKAADARRLWAAYPELTVYNGGMTLGHVGTFAGMTDVQGMDHYIAACAPHITAWGVPRPLQAPFDYLRNTRNNHMPWPTWLYAQGLHTGWNQDALGQTIHVQPDPHEVLVQAFFAVAAGAKGLMWFQTDQGEARHAPARWEAIGQANWMIRTLRRPLREGDPVGAADAGPDALAEVIRAPDALVVPVVNLLVHTPVDDLTCLGALVSQELVPHWGLGEQAPDLSLAVPAEATAWEVFELTEQLTLEPLAVQVQAQTRRLVVPGLELSEQRPVRLVVVALAEGLREELAGEIQAGR